MIKCRDKSGTKIERFRYSTRMNVIKFSARSRNKIIILEIYHDKKYAIFFRSRINTYQLVG